MRKGKETKGRGKAEREEWKGKRVPWERWLRTRHRSRTNIDSIGTFISVNYETLTPCVPLIPFLLSLPFNPLIPDPNGIAYSEGGYTYPYDTFFPSSFLPSYVSEEEAAYGYMVHSSNLYYVEVRESRRKPCLNAGEAPPPRSISAPPSSFTWTASSFPLLSSSDVRSLLSRSFLPSLPASLVSDSLAPRLLAIPVRVGRAACKSHAGTREGGRKEGGERAYKDGRGSSGRERPHVYSVLP